MASLPNLPVELRRIILEYLSPIDLFRVIKCNKVLYYNTLTLKKLIETKRRVWLCNNVGEKYNNWKPVSTSELFMHSCRNGRTKAVQLILRHEVKINVDAVSKYGYTALMYACEAGYTEIVRLLINAGANIKTDSEFGNRPFIIACESNHADIVKLFINSGVDVNAATLIFVCRISVVNTSIVQLLLDSGVDVNVSDIDGYTALMAACDGGCLKTVQLLLNRGANINAVEGHGFSSLMIACQRGYIGIVRMLLDSGANINLVSRDGKTALMYAHGRKKLVRLFTP